MLIAEDEEGRYEPVGVVVSINEAREVAAVRRLERGNDDDWGDLTTARAIQKTKPSGPFAISDSSPLKR